jgi:hypothetical protein
METPRPLEIGIVAVVEIVLVEQPHEVRQVSLSCWSLHERNHLEHDDERHGRDVQVEVGDRERQGRVREELASSRTTMYTK